MGANYELYKNIMSINNRQALEDFTGIKIQCSDDYEDAEWRASRCVFQLTVDMANLVLTDIRTGKKIKPAEEYLLKK